MDIIQNMMDSLYAKCIPHITDCVMAHLEKLGSKYRIVKDPEHWLWVMGDFAGPHREDAVHLWGAQEPSLIQMLLEHLHICDLNMSVLQANTFFPHLHMSLYLNLSRISEVKI